MISSVLVEGANLDPAAFTLDQVDDNALGSQASDPASTVKRAASSHRHASTNAAAGLVVQACSACRWRRIRAVFVKLYKCVFHGGFFGWLIGLSVRAMWAQGVPPYRNLRTQKSC
jgi:hypothetical protein